MANRLSEPRRSKESVVLEIEYRERQRRRALAALACDAELMWRKAQRAICKELESIERDRSMKDARELEEAER